jgi:Tol biopolymer transport system component
MHDNPGHQKTYLRIEMNPRRRAMKKQSICFGIMGLLVFAALLGAFSQAGEDLFQKALRMERNEGKLQEAIALYTQVVAEKKNESLAAQAQLRIGLCYEKLGQKSIQQAQEAFQKVIENYPTQSAEVKIAREKLTAILKPGQTTDVRDQAYQMNPIWSEAEMQKIPGEGSGITNLRPSPDGKYMAFIDWMSGVGELAIYQAATGKVTCLTEDRSPQERTAHAYDSRWSWDSRRLAYIWENDDKNYVDLRVMGLTGSKPSTLYRGSYAEGYMIPLDWSPDGKNILALKDGKFFRLAIIPVDGGGHRIIKAFEPGDNPGGGLFSPDGRFIAYDSQQDKEDVFHDIYLLDLDSGQQRVVASHPSHDYLLGWAPDGSKLVFASERTGTMDCWTIPVLDGRPAGKPSLAIQNMGYINPLGITLEGTLYFDRNPDGINLNIYTAAFDPESGKVESPPEILPLPHEGRNAFPDWSPDGSTLAYISLRKPPGRRLLCLYSVDSGKIREMPFRQVLGDPNWSRDSRFLFVKAQNSSQIFQIDVKTTEIQTLVEGDVVYFPTASPDMNFLYYANHYKEPKHTCIVKRNLKTGNELEIYNTSWVLTDFELSPDGRRVAVMIADKPYGPAPSGMESHNILGVVSSSGGELTPLHEFLHPAASGLVAIDWSPDGRYIVFSKIRTEESQKVGALTGPWQLWRVPAEGGQAEYLGLECRRFRSLSVHPDGHRVAFFSYGTEDGPQPPRYWLVKNFLPQEKNSR